MAGGSTTSRFWTRRGAARSATVISTENVRALKIEREDFYDILEERNEIAQGIIKVLTWRLRQQNERLNTA